MTGRYGEPFKLILDSAVLGAGRSRNAEDELENKSDAPGIPLLNGTWSCAEKPS